MTSENVGQRDRRQGTHTLVDKLLSERQQMLVLYERVAGIEPFDAKAPSRELLAEFSQILVDYIAAGHFGLYERIAAGKERRQSVQEIAQRLYPRIADTTEKAIAFNDTFEQASKNAPPNAALSQALSKLGESLALRIELEDELIAAMLGR